MASASKLETSILARPEEAVLQRVIRFCLCMCTAHTHTPLQHKRIIMPTSSKSKIVKPARPNTLLAESIQTSAWTTEWKQPGILRLAKRSMLRFKVLILLAGTSTATVANVRLRFRGWDWTFATPSLRVVGDILCTK